MKDFIDQDNQNFVDTNRFKIQKQLGSGGFGIVYKAYDCERDSIVALKYLHEIDAENLYLFKQEFRSIADIVHPNIVTLYELMFDGHKWFFTMELVEGTNFLEYIQILDSTKDYTKTPSCNQTQLSQAETVRFSEVIEENLIEDNAIPLLSKGELTGLSIDINKLVNMLKQLAEAINVIHEANKLHRDIKPSNVLVTKEGRVVLLDFGLVVDISYGSQRSARIVGTPPYMSPEQSIGQSISKASDWYSVGVMLYQVLTGRLPFIGNWQNVAREKQKTEPLPPSEVVDNIPKELDELCQDLLRRDPKKRPSGKEIVRRLNLILPNTSTSVNDSTIMVSPENKLLLVGRQKQLAVLKEAFESVKNGQATSVYISGQSGMGKSTLIRHFLDEVKHVSSDVLILSSRCYEQETVPYKALDGIIDSLSKYLRRLPLFEAESLLPRNIQALARIFPVLNQVEAVSKAQQRDFDILDSQEIRRRAFAALRNLLSRIAIKKTLIIFIDDLQWGDLDSELLLREILSPPDPPDFLLIGSYRSEEIESSKFLQAFRSFQKNNKLSMKEIIIDELSFEEASELAKELFGEQYHLSTTQAEEIARESGGNPFFINELVQYSKSKKGTLDVNLENLVQARVSLLPKEARSLLEVIAIAGQPLERNIAKSATFLDMDENKIVALLKASYMIKISNLGEKTMIETYHDRIRKGIVSYLSSEEIRTYHESLALALETFNITDLERLITHFQGAGNSEKAHKYIVLAADKAYQMLAFDRAAQLYKLALEINTLEAKYKQTLLVKLANSLANASYSKQAAEVYLSAARDVSDNEIIELQKRAAQQFLISGYIDEGLVVLNKILSKVGMKLPKSSFTALVLIFFLRIQLFLQGLNFNVREKSQIPEKELLYVDICRVVAAGLFMVDNIKGAYFQTRHMLYSLKMGEKFEIAWALSAEHLYLATSRRRNNKLIKEIGEKATILAKEVNSAYMMACVIGSRGTVALLQGKWQQSYKLHLQSEEIFRTQCTGVTWELNTLHIYSLRCLFYLGKFNELFSRLPVLLKEAKEQNNLYAESLLRLRSSHFFSLVMDNSTEAAYELEQSINKWSQQGFHYQHFLYFYGQIETYLYNSDGQKAWHETKTNLWPKLKKSFFLRTQLIFIESIYLQARAALAAAITLDKPSKLLSIVRKNIEKMKKEKILWGNALAQLVEAGLATVLGNKKKAISLLASAEIEFATADMAFYEMVTKYRRGQLIGEQEGELLVDTAKFSIISQGVKNIECLLNMFAPGKWLS